MKDVSLGGWRRVTRSGATPAVLVHEREEKPPAVRQNQVFYPNGRWWHVPGNQ